MKVKSTKSALLMSFTSLLLCFAMLIGCTFAWFTDSVTSGVNKIVAGNLDVEVEYYDGSKWTSIEGADSLFSKGLWEPGHTEFVTLKVENKGTLALKYQLNVSPVSESGGINVNGESFKLSDHLMFGTTEASPTEPAAYTRETARAAVTASQKGLTQTALKKGGTLLAKGANDNANPAQYITLVVYMPESVGNEANYKTGTAAPYIDLGITVVATQKDHEVDSFDNTYDAGAGYDPAKAAVEYNYFPQVNVAAQLVIDDNDYITEGSEAAGSVTVTPLENEPTKSKVVMSSSEQIEGASAAKLETIVQKDVGDQQTGSMTLKVVKDDTANANFQTKADSPIDTTKQDSTTYEVKVETEGVVAVPEADGKANFKVELFIGKSRTNVKMYHSGSPMNENTSGAPDTFTYNPTSGYVTMFVDEFSPFTAVYDMPVAAIGTTVYYTLQAAIDAVQADGTVTLLCETNACFDVTNGQRYAIDLNGNTLTLDNAVGSTGTETSGIRILHGGTLSVKNGSVVCSSVKNAKNKYVRVGFSNYGTLVLENVKMTVSDGATLWTISNRGELTLKGDCDIPAASRTEETKNVNCTCAAINMTPYNYANDGYNAVLNVASSAVKVANIVINDETDTERSNQNGKSVLNISAGTYGAITVSSDSDKHYQYGITGNITGGTFSTDPTAYVADGYKATKSGDVWTVGTYVEAKIGTTTYASLADAIAAVPTDGTETTITISDNIGSEEKWEEYAKVYVNEIANGQNVVLDLAGHQIYAKTTVDGETCYLRVENGGKLTIKDSKTGGAIYYVDGKDNAGGFVVCSAGELILESGHLENKTECKNSAIQGAVDVHANEWGTYYTKDTTFVMNGGSLASHNDNTLRMYDSSQVGSDKVNIKTTINNGTITGADAVFIMTQYYSGPNHIVNGSKNHMNNMSLTVNNGSFTTKNGIRVVGNVAAAKGELETSGINITVKGGTFTTTDTAKYRVHDIAFQESGGWSSTKESTSNLRSYVTVNGQSCITEAN